MVEATTFSTHGKFDCSSSKIASIACSIAASRMSGGTSQLNISHFVYLYRSMNGQPKYVGYGMSVERALSHAGISHNDALRTWLKDASFELEVCGPYRDQTEGKNVEAALISALRPEFNRSPGDGPKFVPVGVPPALGERPTLSALTLPEIGQQTGGALLVYLAPGDFLGDGRRKFDPAQPDDEIVVSNMEGVWDIGRHHQEWKAKPTQSPKVLLGIHGRVKHRFVVGAARIDTARWFTPDLEVRERRRWKVPLQNPVHLDEASLRGRKVEGAKFGQFSWQLHIWIDGNGTIRHPSTH